MINLKFLPFVIFAAIIFYSCSAATDTRYSKDSEKEISKTKEKEIIAEDDFDIKPYRTKIDIPEEKKQTNNKPLDLWFAYSDSISEDQTHKTVVDTIPGYRVQVISSFLFCAINNIRQKINDTQVPSLALFVIDCLRC